MVKETNKHYYKLCCWWSLAGDPEKARQSADAQVEPRINMTQEKASR